MITSEAYDNVRAVSRISVPMPTVETSRLVLRLPQADDAEPLMQIHNDPEALKYVVFGTTACSVTAPSKSKTSWSADQAA